ncbi:hypothetical protein IFR05_006972 [Cadophora sp. M221]|nr:hypothetical protein IFR05_006972 [Cadophora sp. M221]
MPLTPSIKNLGLYDFQLPNQPNCEPTPTQKRPRKLTPQGRLDAAETRKRGACTRCRVKKIKCSHSWQSPLENETPSLGLVIFEDDVPSESATWGQLDSLKLDSALPTTGDYNIGYGTSDDFNVGAGFSIAEADAEEDNRARDDSWLWNEHPLMDRDTTNMYDHTAKPLKGELGTFWDPFGRSSISPIQSGQSFSSSSRSNLHGPQSTSEECLNADLDRSLRDVHFRSLKPQTNIAALQSRSSNQTIRQRSVDPRDGATPTSYPADKHMGGKPKFDIMAGNKPSSAGRSCANNTSTSLQTWKCCCGRSVMTSSCPSGQALGVQRPSHTGPIQGSTALDQSPGLSSKATRFTSHNLDGASTDGSPSRKRIKIFVDPSSPTIHQDNTAARLMSEPGCHTNHYSDVFGISSEVFNNHKIESLAPKINFDSAVGGSDQAHYPTSALAADLPLYGALDIATRYSPVAYLSNRMPATPNTNKFGDMFSGESPFNSQTPSMGQRMHTPDLSFISASSATKIGTPQSARFAPSHSLSRGAEMFGEARRKIDFGSQTTACVKNVDALTSKDVGQFGNNVQTALDYNVFGLDFELYPANSLGSFSDFDLVNP